MATTVRKGDRAPGSKPVSEQIYHGSTALYGKSSTGKTTLASTYPKPILYFNIRDNGTDSISDVEDIDVVDINTSEELREQILWLTKQANRNKLIYKTVVLDTMTQLQTIMVQEMGEVIKTRLASKKKRPGEFGSLQLQEWGIIAGDLKAVIMDIRNLPVESVFIAQERVFNDEDEDDGASQIAPEVGTRLMKSVNSDLCASVAVIGNTFIRVKVTKEKVDNKIVKKIEKLYCLRLGPNEVYTTKIRKPKGIQAPDFIEDPTFRKIKKIMKGIE
jgi:hypothetical protein